MSKTPLQTIINPSTDPTLTVYANNNQSVPAISGNTTVVITNTEQYITAIYNLKAAVAGSVTEVQFNDGSGLSADSGLTYIASSDTLNVAGNVITGNIKTDNILHANGVAWNFSQSSYSNANVQSLLPTYTGDITADTVAAINLSGALLTNAQPNITSIGTLTGLTVQGNINFTGNVNATGNIVPSANVTYNLGSPSLRFKDLYLAGTTIDLGGTLIQTAANGQISFGNVTFSSNGTITGTNITGQVPNALVASTVYTGAQPNITAVGTLTSLSVTTSATFGGNLVAGNLSVSGATSTERVNFTNNSNIRNVGNLMMLNGAPTGGVQMVSRDANAYPATSVTTTNDNVDVMVGTKNWHFNSSGDITVDGDGGFTSSTANTVMGFKINNATKQSILTSEDTQNDIFGTVTASGASGNVRISAGSGSTTSSWLFDYDGVTYLPGGIQGFSNSLDILNNGPAARLISATGSGSTTYFQTSSISGSQSDFSAYIVVDTTPDNGSAKTWRFDNNGRLNVPGDIANLNSGAVLNVRSAGSTRLSYAAATPNTVANTINYSTVAVSDAGVTLEVTSANGTNAEANTVSLSLAADGNLNIPGNIIGTGQSSITVSASGGVGSYITIPKSTFGGERLDIVNEFSLGNGIALATTGGEWHFDNTGKLSIPGNLTFAGGSSYGNSLSTISNDGGFVFSPTYNGSGRGPDFRVDYNDGMLISVVTNDYFRTGKASPLFIEGASLYSGNSAPGDVNIAAGTNTSTNAKGNVNIGTYQTNKVSIGANAEFSGAVAMSSGLNVTGGLSVSGSINLGNTSNINIYGATANGQALTSDINGHLTWSDLPNPGKVNIVNVIGNTTASVYHAGKLIVLDPVSPDAIAFDIPNVNTSGFSVGSRIELFVGSQSSIIIEPAAGSGVTIVQAKGGEAALSSQNVYNLSNTATAKLTMYATDKWLLSA